MGSMIYNVNSTATQVLAAKQIKENIFMELLHRNGKGINQVEEVNASTVRMFKVVQFEDDARTIGDTDNGNGGFFNKNGAGAAQVIEYDLNLLHIYDKCYDLPEVQQDMCPVSIFDGATKNLAGRVATEINASTLAYQLTDRFDAASKVATPSFDNIAVVLGSTPDYYGAYMDASSMLDDGDEENGIQSFPFEERQLLVSSDFRKGLMSAKGVLLGGSNFAQSMLAKGAVSPEEQKEFGSMYIGEIDRVPVYLIPAPIWKRAGKWTQVGTIASGSTTWAQGSSDTWKSVKALLLAASATDRGIATQDYVKIVDSPDGAGKRLQPKTRWGVNVVYGKGIVPILANGTAAPDDSKNAYRIKAPGNQA